MQYLSLDTPEQRWVYASIVWELIVLTYKEYGNSEDGNLYGAKITDLVKTPGHWILVEIDGVVVAGVIFRSWKGNKMRLVLHNNTRVGKDALKEMYVNEFASGRCWGEVSGHLERILRERGLKPIPNSWAGEILEKEIFKLEANGENYMREVYPDIFKRQVLFGTVEST